MVTRFPRACDSCVRVHEEDPSNPLHATCDAFPDGIPSVILSGENDHTEPVAGDDGQLYEEDLEQEGAMLAYRTWRESPMFRTYIEMINE